MILPPIILVIFIMIIVKVVTQHAVQLLKFNLPPGPIPWPIVGNIFSLKPIKFRSFNEWAQSYGPIISVWFGSTLNIVVSNLKLAEEVSKKYDYELVNRQRVNLELFTNTKIEALRFIREEEVSFMVKSIYKDCTFHNGENMKNVTITIRKYLIDMAFNHITRLTFGKRFINSKGEFDLQGHEFMNIILNVRSIKKPPMVVEYVPWMRWMSRWYGRSLVMHKNRMYGFAKEILREDNKSPFIDGLVSCKDDHNLSEEIIIDFLWDMIITGMDTIATAVEWAMAELLRHPRVLRKVQHEIDQIITRERIVNEDDLVALPYLQAIIKEALRMHPPTPLILQHCANANIKIAGYDVPMNTTVHVNVWAIGRDPDVWTDPHEFRPERFLEDDVHNKGSDFRLILSGSGRTMCLGAQLELNLVTLMLGRLLHHFDWNLPNGIKSEDIPMSETPGIVSSMAIALQVVPIPRLPSHLYNRIESDM